VGFECSVFALLLSMVVSGALSGTRSGIFRGGCQRLICWYQVESGAQCRGNLLANKGIFLRFRVCAKWVLLGGGPSDWFE